MNNGKLESCDAVNTIEMFILENLAQSETPWASTLVTARGKDRGQALTLPKVGILQKTSTQNCSQGVLPSMPKWTGHKPAMQ